MEITDKKFHIRSYGCAELGQLYSPETTKESASHKLRAWIRLSKELSARLAETEYKRYAKILTPKQMKIITEHLGEP